MLVIILAVLAAAGIGLALAVAAWSFFRGRVDGTKLEAAGERAKELISRAEEEQRKLILAAQEEALKLRAAGENEVKEQRQELNRVERRYLQREEQLERKTEVFEKQQRELADKEGEVQRAHTEAEALKTQQLQTLEEIAGLTVAGARQMVVKRGEEDAQHDLARRYYELEKESKEKADENARSIITLAISRLATDVVSEVTTSVVSLPNDEMKGRLIGREGRNIRTLESLTGVDVIIDDTPEVVTISCFDPVRREVARLALEKLIADGRIQPAPHRRHGPQGPRRGRTNHLEGWRSSHFRGRRQRSRVEFDPAFGPAQVQVQLRGKRTET